MHKLIIHIHSFFTSVVAFVSVLSLHVKLLYHCCKHNRTDLFSPPNPPSEHTQTWLRLTVGTVTKVLPAHPIHILQIAVHFCVLKKKVVGERCHINKVIIFDPSSRAPGRKETLSVRFVYCRRKLSTWVFARLE